LRYVCRASSPISVSGTTSRAENTAPTAITEVGVPVQYRWCSVPRMPPKRNTMVSATIARFALAARTSPSFVKISAHTAVANTSKKPSTHRCTSHQRQYSIIE
jgi:hypothetical protein